MYTVFVKFYFLRSCVTFKSYQQLIYPFIYVISMHVVLSIYDYCLLFYYIRVGQIHAFYDLQLNYELHSKYTLRNNLIKVSHNIILHMAPSQRFLFQPSMLEFWFAVIIPFLKQTFYS